MFRSIFNNQQKNANIKLVSQHIPKTAGTSFRNTLIQEYGEKRVIRVDIREDNHELSVNQNTVDKLEIFAPTEIIHGHFSIPGIYELLSLNLEETPCITWLRNPVDRVVSNYYYLSGILDGIVQEGKKNLHILEKMQKSPEEFVATEINRNRIYKFINGFDLEKYLFIGLVEQYEEDLKLLSKKLNWNKTHVFNVNQSMKKRKVSDSLRQMIIEMNQEDIKIYQEVLKMRKIK